MRSLSLTSLILIGLVFGILTGLGVGERAEVLSPIGDRFIRLLQMAVLPYFIVALPLGFTKKPKCSRCVSICSQAFSGDWQSFGCLGDDGQQLQATVSRTR